jgi:hypothetical protein
MIKKKLFAIIRIFSAELKSSFSIFSFGLFDDEDNDKDDPDGNEETCSSCCSLLGNVESI